VIRRLVVLVSALTLMAVTPVVAQGPDSRVPDEVRREINSEKQSGVYLVRLAADPAVAYEGGVRGLAATKPAAGKKIDPTSGAVRRYTAHLTARHDQVLQAVPGATKIADYVYSYNGFAAVMSAAQADVVRQIEDVQAVVKDELRQPTTDRTPDFLGLRGSGGLWDDVGGVGQAGEDIIIGVIDTGIWPEHPSFSDQVDLADRPGSSGKRTRAYDAPPAHWHGSCQSGEQWSKDDCNYKLIGARYFLAGHTHAGIIGEDFKSARDADGHGTHTASTAGGNAGVSASILGADLGTVSGMAPRARIAAYKACWVSGCATSDLVSAIDRAVADGVDVINYSIGSSASTLLGEDDVAFLFAALNGVYVATSAGNDGPDASTVGSPASVPWLTTVGASTKDRTFQNTVELGNGSAYTGASVTGGTAQLPIVDAAALTPNAGFDADDVRLCFVGSLPSAAVQGKIVLCQRGTTARVEKSQAVGQAGGAGMVLYNALATEATVTDNHYVPTSHVSLADGQAIKAYIASAGAGAVATITASEIADAQGSVMADFSSRGPNRAAGDLMKPDVTAPGVNILAGNTPAAVLGAPGQLFQAISGTSMSSPHVAGIGALLRQAHPEWTPAMIKSALMTTARQDVVKEDGATAADPFDMGAGHVVPTSATDPGLVYDAGLFDYFAFLCGATSAVHPDDCAFLEGEGYSFDASDLNLAAVGIAELAGVQTITRTVTNVGPAGTYEVAVDAPAGIGVEVTPSTLTLDAGETATFEVSFTTLSGADIDAWTFGSFTWSDGSRSVRSPLAIKPTALSAPDEQMGTGTSGSLTYEVTFGYEGPFAADDWGLVAATETPGNVVDDPANDINVALETEVGVTFHEVVVPAGTEYARFSLFDDYTDGEDDLDLYVFGSGPDFPFAGGSGSPSSEEEVSIDEPAAGTYLVVVHGWQTDGADANYTLFNWNVPAVGSGTMTVTSSTAMAALAETATIDVAWTGLTAGTKYLGAVAYNAGATGQTIIRVDTD
jgi:subtilisin family serine protease